MGFSLGNLFMVGLLFTNAAAILHEQRFLNKYGWGKDSAGPPESVKYKLVSMLSAVRMLMRPPLIVCNVLVISYQLVLG